MRRPNYFITYQNATSRLIQIKSNCARDFLLFGVFETMRSGEFWSGKGACEKFNRFLKDNGKKPYQQNTFNIAISELRTLKIIIKLDRGLYAFNPDVMWRGGREEREEFIKWLKKREEGQSHKNKAASTVA